MVKNNLFRKNTDLQRICMYYFLIIVEYKISMDTVKNLNFTGYVLISIMKSPNNYKYMLNIFMDRTMHSMLQNSNSFHFELFKDKKDQKEKKSIIV